jgi:2-dehydro-3-deoxygluconokinase
VVVKDGAVGAHSLAAGQVFVPAPKVTVVEVVGAGDAFAAGYLAGVLAGDDETARLRLGHLVAASTLRVRSDHARLPSRAWLRQRVGLPADEWARLAPLGES